MRKLYSLYAASLTLALLAPAHVGATSIVAADDGGYAGNVIEKVGNEWAPPPGLRGNFSVRIKVTVGEDGKVRSCKPTEASAIKALDDAACGAVYKAAPFGKTPDGKPVDVHMAFRIGSPKKAPREPSFEEAAIETMKERERLNNQMANEKASYQSSRAKEQAEALAQKMGKPLPDLHMPPLEVSKPVPVPSPLARNKKGAASSADDSARLGQTKQEQNRQKIESSGVPIGGDKKERGQEKAPELVIKSNLKNLDAALEAQSEATAEAQAPQPSSANSPITFVNRPSASETNGSAVVPPQAKTVASSLTQDELDVPPLEHLKAEVILLPAPAEPQTEPEPEAKTPEPAKQEPTKAESVMQSQSKAEQAKSKPTPDAGNAAKAPAPTKVAPEPAKATKPAATTGNTASEMAGETIKSSPAEKEKPAIATPAKAQEQQQAPATEPLASATSATSNADNAKPAPADMSYAEYLDRLKQDIRKKIKLPKLPQGYHSVSVQLYLSQKGRIQRADLIYNSNNVRRDEQLTEAVKQVGKVTPPPAALGRSFPLTLVFDVK